MLITIPAITQAQFNYILKRAKDKVTNRVDNKVDKEIDKKLDELEGKETAKADTKTTVPSKDATTATASEPVKVFSKFDFLPGEKIIYSEDFSQDTIGELPLTWNSRGKGEIMTLNNLGGKWLRVFQNNTSLTGNKKGFGENYTIELNLMCFFEPKVKGYVLPRWNFSLFSRGGIDATDIHF